MTGPAGDGFGYRVELEQRVVRWSTGKEQPSHCSAENARGKGGRRWKVQGWAARREAPEQGKETTRWRPGHLAADRAAYVSSRPDESPDRAHNQCNVRLACCLANHRAWDRSPPSSVLVFPPIINLIHPDNNSGPMLIGRHWPATICGTYGVKNLHHVPECSA